MLGENLRERLRDPQGLVASWCGGFASMAMLGTAILVFYFNRTTGIGDAQRILAVMLPFMIAALVAWGMANRATKLNKPQIAAPLWLLAGLGLALYLTQQRDDFLQDNIEMILDPFL